jgi:phosphoglycolate phosphatase-like HAD superfamily hydrolase
MKFLERYYPKMNLLGNESAGGGSTPPPSDAPPASDFTPPEWAKGLSVEADILKAPMFSSVKTIDDVVKGYYHAQKMVGADKIVVPTKNSSAEEWKAFYNKAGVPEKLEDFIVETPYKGTDFEKSLIQKAYDLNLRPDQLSEMVNMLESRNDQLIQEYEQEEAQNLAETTDSLRKEWGQAFDRKISEAQKVIKHFGGDELFKEIVSDPSIANNKNVLKLLAEIGGKLNREDTFQSEVVTKFGLTKDEAKKKVNEMMGNMSGPYHNREHAQHKDAVDQMLAWQEIISQ